MKRLARDKRLRLFALFISVKTKKRFITFAPGLWGFSAGGVLTFFFGASETKTIGPVAPIIGGGGDEDES
jgi:hypothetical protein